jgi:uracil-DNA glycosylase
MSLAQHIPPAWKAVLQPFLSSPSFAALDAFVAEQYASVSVFPPHHQIFAALELTPPEAVRVVLLGQDPYPTPGNAHGLAFSVTRHAKIPASLKNLFAGLQLDLGVPPPLHGDLTAWARQGILLLNTVLTVREREPHSHQKKGWELFTREVLKHVAAQPRAVVFLCLGKPALKLVESLGTHQPIVCAPHPSPLNQTAFVDAVRANKIFTTINGLVSPPIDWST